MGSHEHFDILIRGGTVIDGTRSPRFQADLGIRDGKIVALRPLPAATAEHVIEADGYIVAPGFIDSHAHDDKAVLLQPEMVSKVSQGVCTVVAGNCGISLAPLLPDLVLPMPLALVEASPPPRELTFRRFADYLDALDESPASVNVAALVGHTTLRAVTMDDLERAATPDEIHAMQRLAQEALAAGAIGISTGTAYAPAAPAPTEELIEVCRPLTGTGGVYVTHMRNEGEHIVAALEETFKIGRELDVPVVISHHKVARPTNFGRSAETLSLIRKAMQGQCVGLDCYPYHAGSTMLHALESKLNVPVLVASSDPYPEHAGRDLSDIAQEWGVSRIEAARRLQPGSAVYFSLDENDVQNILAFEETMIGSDGIHLGERPHPRLWGTFPRVLGHYSRDLGLFSLETAVWKMTGLTASTFGLLNRGILAVGNHADVVIFNADNVRDRATFESPVKPAQGIEWVIVNGSVTWNAGAHTGVRAGHVLRHSPGSTGRTSSINISGV